MALHRTSHFPCLLFLWQFVISTMVRNGRPSVLAWSHCPLFHSLGTKPMYSKAQQWSFFAVRKGTCALFSFLSTLAKPKTRQTETAGYLLSSFAHRYSFVLFLHLWTTLKISSPLCPDTQIT